MSSESLKQAQKKYREGHKEKIGEIAKKANKKYIEKIHNDEEYKAKRRAYYKAYYERNKAKVIEKVKAYQTKKGKGEYVYSLELLSVEPPETESPSEPSEGL